MKRLVFSIVALGLLGWLGYSVYAKLSTVADEAPTKKQRGPAPVEVAPIEHGPIERQRVFSGTLEARANFIVAPKIAGRVERLTVDLADTVKRGQIVAELDDAELVQAVAQADADRVVAEAKLAEAENALAIAQRELKRMETLQSRGVASESQFDTSKADQLSKEAAVKVAQAQLNRAESALESTKIRQGYTRVVASWTGGKETRVVAERFVDAGDTVAANTPMLSIVELDPINAVMFVTEKDYGRLEHDQAAILTTDAYGSQTFAGKITRVSPVFRQNSRQARVELSIANPDYRLKPGMFVRAQVMLGRVEDATIVPEDALVKRNETDGLFILSDDGKTVSWRPITIGIRNNRRVQVIGENIAGRVVTLGQQLIEDGSEITIPADVSTSQSETPSP